MKKTRKYFSLFAILLMVIFAVGCVFMTACGNKDDDDEKETTHTHTYDGGVVTKEATCGEDGEMTYTCVDGDDSYTEVIPATGEHTWDDGEVTTEATCVDGETTYTCTVCGKTKTKAITATMDHTFTQDVSRVSFTWTEDSEKGYIVTATITCAVCETAIDVPENSITVIGPQEGMYGEYTASVTYEDVTAEETRKLEEPQLPYDPEKNVYQWSVDYSDATTYGWMTEGLTPADNGAGGQMYTLATNTSYSNGIVTYTTHSSGNNTINSENAGALFTAGTSSNFKIDLSGYVGDYVEITVRMSSNGSDSETATDGRILAVNTSVNTNNPLDSVTSNYKTDYQTLNYGGEITQEGTQLYLAWIANVRIFSVEIDIYGDVAPEATTTITLDQTTLNLTITNGTATGTITAAIVDASGEPYTGDLPTVVSSDETDVDVSIEKDGEDGKYTITVTVKAEVEDVTITVTADDVTESITLSAKNASVTMVVNKDTMNLLSVGDSDTSVVALTDEWGKTYGGGGYEVKIDYGDGSVATATYADGKITITAVAKGNVDVEVSLVKDNETVSEETISVTVAISGITDGYTATYTANKETESFVLVTDESDGNASTAVTFTNSTSTSNFNDSQGEKASRTDSNVKYTDYTNINASGQVINVVVGAGVEAEITVYASHSSSAARDVYIKDSTGGILAGQTIDGTTSPKDTVYLWPVTAVGLGEGTYTICSDGTTIHVYAVVVTYRYASEETDGDEDSGEGEKSDEPQSTTVTVGVAIEGPTVETGEYEDDEVTPKTEVVYAIVADYNVDVDSNNQVSFNYSNESLSGSNSSVTDEDGTSYAYRLEISASKSLTIVIPAEATNVSITALIYNSNEGRIGYLGKNGTSTAEGDVVDSETFTKAGDSMTTAEKFITLTGENLTGGSYTLFATNGSSSNSGMYICEIVITYTI